MQIALTGDVMLGRMVDQEVIRNQSLRPEAVWGDVLPILLAADLRVINLECVISARGREWRPQSKAFHFRAHPRAIDCLKSASIDAVTLANNHVLDYGAEALLDCLGLLDRAGITHAGAGRNLATAMEPAFLSSTGSRVAVLALTDNEPDWEAADVKPGVVYVAYDRRGLKEPYRARVADAIKRARRQAGLVLVSAHVGPNWGAPSVEMRALAHELLDLGADLYWGHSNHSPQGIELYHGKAILYSSGDFIDDYMVDENERNDLSFLFVLDVEPGRVARIRLHPVRIEHCRVRLARHQDALFLQKTMQAKCAALGTPIAFHDGVGSVTIG